MSSPQRKSSGKRPFLVPLAAGLVTLTAVREGLPQVWDGVSSLMVFFTAVAFGYLAYAGTEWLLMRRQRQQRSKRQP